MGLELQEAAECWAGPEGVALRNEEEVTESSTIPGFSTYLGSWSASLGGRLVPSLCGT